ncbi:hypothetical protein PBI_PEREGRIN_159 [Rhodococcus phage Peregrin]|nr:hypothetical protein PBI_PEREGRIN_159 [Rhodococcus phage Peregrin]
MAFYELIRLEQITRRPYVSYRSSRLDKVIQYMNELSYDDSLKILKVEFVENDDGSIDRYEFKIYGTRNLGPIFLNLPAVGFFDYRNEDLTDDQKTILGIYLKKSKSTMVDGSDITSYTRLV